MQEAVQNLLGMGISEGTWDLVSLPIRLGCLGISDPHLVQPSARFVVLMNLVMPSADAMVLPAQVLATRPRIFTIPCWGCNGN